MQLDKIKSSIIGKWKCIENPDLILDFLTDEYLISNKSDDRKIYTISKSDIPGNEILFCCVGIGFWTSFIDKLSESEMAIINIDDDHHKDLIVSDDDFKILSPHSFFNFVRL